MLFNLGPDIILNRTQLGVGAFILPVNTQAYQIELPPNAKLAGIRFHPGYGGSILGRHSDKPMPIAKTHDLFRASKGAFIHLSNTTDETEQLSILQPWLDVSLANRPLIPDSLENAIHYLRLPLPLKELEHHVGKSNRQIERQFKTWLGITPKHLQRIFRVKQAIEYLRLSSPTDLAQMSLDMGFSDQAHMTREFQRIARTTPGQFITNQRISKKQTARLCVR